MGDARAGLLLVLLSASGVRQLRPVRQGPARRRLVAGRRGARPRRRRRRRARRGGRSCCGAPQLVRRAAHPRPGPRVRHRRRRGRAGLLLHRRAHAAGRRRAAAGVPRPGARRRLAVAAHRHAAPRRARSPAAALALVGTVGVLDVLGGVRLDPAGVLWALAAAVCLACYFLMMGAEPADDALDPPVLACAGMGVGAVVVASPPSLAGVLPVTFGGGTRRAGRARACPRSLPGARARARRHGARLPGRRRRAVPPRCRASGPSSACPRCCSPCSPPGCCSGSRRPAAQLAGGALVVTGVALARTGGAGAAAPARRQGRPSRCRGRAVSARRVQG